LALRKVKNKGPCCEKERQEEGITPGGTREERVLHNSAQFALNAQDELQPGGEKKERSLKRELGDGSREALLLAASLIYIQYYQRFTKKERVGKKRSTQRDRMGQRAGHYSEKTCSSPWRKQRFSTSRRGWRREDDQKRGSNGRGEGSSQS